MQSSNSTIDNQNLRSEISHVLRFVDRNVSILLYDEYGLQRGKKSKYCRVARYENVTQHRLPYLIMEDHKLGKDNGLFHLLLIYRQNMIQNHALFNPVLEWMKDRSDHNELRPGPNWTYNHDIEPKLIEYLYTEIMKPEDLLVDIEKCEYQQKWDHMGKWGYHVCFEDESSWKCLEQLVEED